MTKFLILMVLASLSTYRLARLISIENGPFYIFFHLRRLMGAYDLKENGQPGMLGEMISCPYCIGVYISLFMVILVLYLNNPVTEVFLMWMGIAGVQSLLQSIGRD